jgi:uncharacterized membrane protein YbaN (DUF454 family)
MTDPVPLPQTCCRTARSRFERIGRWLLAGIGLVAVGMAGVGAVVPGLPTTVFLIIASACFTKSCPWLERRLLRNRFFAPYMRYIDEPTAMPRRAKIVTIALVWVSILTSAFLLHRQDGAPDWVVIVVVLCAPVATAAILIWTGTWSRRRVRAS